MAATTEKPASAGQITDEVHVGGNPPGSSTPNSGYPAAAFLARALAMSEYVAGSRLQWYSSYPRALPWSIDDVSTDFGTDIYERMLLDAQVRASVNVFKAAVLETGIQLTSAVDNKLDDGYAEAKDLVDRCESMLDSIDPDLDDTLWDMLDAVALGNRVAEQVYDLETTPSGRQQYTLSRLMVKPVQSIAFVVDVYFVILGILGRVPGQPFGVQQGTLLANIQNVKNFLPRSKFAVLTYRPKNGDPRGTSILRPCFDPWNQKVQLKRDFLKYLAQFATPSLLGFTAEGAESYVLQNPDGSPILDANGEEVWQIPEDQMLAVLQSFVNGTAGVFPNGARVEPLEMKGVGEPFLNAFDFLNTEIVKAILHQTLATEEGEHMARAASEVHKDVLDTIIRQGKRPVCRMISRDLFRTWLMLNGEEDLVTLLPKVGLGQSESEDLSSVWPAAAALYQSGFIHSSQLSEIDKKIGTPERTPPDATSAPVRENVTVQSTGLIEPIPGQIAQPPPLPAGQIAPAAFAQDPTPDREIADHEKDMKRSLDLLFRDQWSRRPSKAEPKDEKPKTP